jgi:hypothetical protein
MLSKEKGEISEAIILAKLKENGKVVLIPFGQTTRYDLLVDNNDGTFTRGQCKTARLSGDSIIFNTCSCNGFNGKRKDYKGDADVFWVYSPDTREVYEIKVEDVPKATCSLKLSDSIAKGWEKRTKLAKNYRI